MNRYNNLSLAYKEDFKVIDSKGMKSKREERSYFLKQRLIGGVFTLLGLICPVLMSGDATISLVIIPLGLCLLFTKEKVIDL